MQTATIAVTYVGPPKQGKQYGFIKGADNTTFPVKQDRIREFEPGNTYELAYTEGTNGFKNIIGVKRIVQQAEPRGEYTEITEPTQRRNGATLTPAVTQAKPQAPQNGYYRPTAPKDSERMWTCAILGHIIDRGGVELNEASLIDAVNTLRGVYQKTYGRDD
ncbi:MAG TPA: hypothetical protein VNY06_05660 [Methylocella sp.]|jgi:hypothetical protein|nr:hypothetical protein [Methylocella sp.]